MPVFVTFWGTRGSIPTPASWTRVYGGNTPCVEIRFDDTLFICDAGSGIRELGKDLARRNPPPKTLHLLISHTHWDHIQGFPYFAPAYQSNMRINVYGQHDKDHTTFGVLSGQMSSEFFPISFKDLGARIVPDHLLDGKRKIDGVEVSSFPNNHPGGCFGYSLARDGRKIVYGTDNELEIQPGDLFPDLDDTGPLRRMSEAMLRVAQNADLLIHDAQYRRAGVRGQKELGALLLFLRHRSGHPGRREKPRPVSSRPRMHRPRRGRESGILPPPRGAARFPPQNQRRPRRRGDEILRRVRAG